MKWTEGLKKQLKELAFAEKPNKEIAGIMGIPLKEVHAGRSRFGWTIAKVEAQLAKKSPDAAIKAEIKELKKIREDACETIKDCDKKMQALEKKVSRGESKVIEDLVLDKSKLLNCGKQPKIKKEKCFAMNKNGKCTALTGYIKKDCGGACPFFKTREEFEEGREKALKRLRSLDEPTRRDIAVKYKIKFELLNVPFQSIDRGPKN